MTLFLGVLTAYLIGSFPTAYIAGRLFKGIDIRGFGSGNIGATNTFRVIGRLPGLVVLAVDVFKGYVSVTFIANAFLCLSPVYRPELYQVFAGFAAIAGHNWTVFLRFKGGKGVATGAGVVIGLMPKIFWFALLIWAVVFIITRYVSVASIIASISVPLFALFFGETTEIIVFTSILSFIIVYKHRPNIKRLMIGEESRISLFKRQA